MSRWIQLFQSGQFNLKDKQEISTVNEKKSTVNITCTYITNAHKDNTDLDKMITALLKSFLFLKEVIYHV